MTSNIAMPENNGSRPEEVLLPGIVDDIVFDAIVPKLQWKDLYILSSVSRAWHNANRSRRVFKSRVLSRSSETFVPVYYSRNTVALYAMRENSWHNLPLITDASGRQLPFPASGQCVSMNGKIYILGGVMENLSFGRSDIRSLEISNKVFVFDLAGQGHWEECARMKQARLDFGSAVLDGKIYVFGGFVAIGTSSREGLIDPRDDLLMSDSEVYEPKGDTWSPIRRMTTCRFGHQATVIGEEVFIYDGRTSGRITSSSSSLDLEAYHPVKDEWRVVQRSWKQPTYCHNFTVQGNLFAIQRDRNLGLERLAIYKYDLDRNSHVQVHSFSFAALVPDARPSARVLLMSAVLTVLTVDDELIALVHNIAPGGMGWRVSMFQSAGFRSKNQKISWKLRATSDIESAVKHSTADKDNFSGLEL